MVFSFDENYLVGPPQWNVVHDDKNPYKCSIWDYKFSEESELTLYIASLHDGSSEIPSGNNENSIVVLSNFTSQISSKHEEKKTFKCTFCDYIF